VLAATFALVAFVLLRTIVSAYYVFADHASEDRLATRHRVSAAVPLPKRYADTVRSLPGVTAATFGTFVGGRFPNRPTTFVPAFAVDPPTLLTVFDEISLPAQAQAAWMEDRQGAIVGEALARKLRLSVGDRVTLVGSQMYGEWQLTIRGVYSTTRKSSDRSRLFFHWDYLNEVLPERQRDEIRMIFTRVDSASAAGGVAEAIDRAFDDKGAPTLTISEKAVSLAALGGVSSVLASVNAASIVILLILMLVLGNTIAMGVRERTSEFATLRALGFSSGQVASIVLGEAITFGCVAGGLGVALSYPVVELGMGRWLEENMGDFVPYFRVEPTTLLATFFIAVAVGLVAAATPAFQAMRVPVVDALRRVG
jgi:putative ABC transport system permease protein